MCLLSMEQIPTAIITTHSRRFWSVAAASISDPLLRVVKYAWGSGFFVAAFACNCLKTAADRHHSWAPQNRWEDQVLHESCTCNVRDYLCAAVTGKVPLE
jgi:hypothetical protein